MKLMQILAFGLVLTFTGTACKHKSYTTPLPNGHGSGTGTGTGTDLPPGPTITPDGGAGGSSVSLSGVSTADFDLSQYNQDRAALAAHTVHFDYDSAAIKSSEEANVAAVAAALQGDASAKLLIEGHCDERGTDEYNRSLGERRALALREALGRGGVDPNRIRTISYGKDRPVANGHDESSWSQNRRGEFVLLHPK